MRNLGAIKEEYFNSKEAQAYDLLSTTKEDFEYIPKPRDLSDYDRYLKTVKKIFTSVQHLKLEYSTIELKQKIEEEYKPIIEEYHEKEIAINTKYETLADNRIEYLENQAKEYNQKVVNEFNESNHVYIELEEKRKELESYSEDIISLCSAYGITTEDVSIDNSSFTVEELGDIYDEYIDYIHKLKVKQNPIGWFRSTFDDVVFQGTVLGIILLLSFTILLDFVSIAFFSFIIFNQLKAKEKMKTYSVLLGLIFNIQPLTMGFKNEIDAAKLKEVSVDEEHDEQLNNITDEWENALNELDSDNPEKELKKIILELINNTKNIEDEMQAFADGYNKKKEELLEIIRKVFIETKAEFEDKKSKIKLLGSEIACSVVFNTNFRLGLKGDVFEEYKDIGLSNIIIRPSEDRTKMKAFLQVLLANAFCNVKENCLTVTVYDPNNFGQDLVGFYRSELEKVLIFKNAELDSTIESLKEYAMNNMKTMRGKTINEFNQEAEKIGKTAKEYKLLIVLSQPKTIDEDESLTEFMSYSAELGVFVWLVTSKTIPKTVVFEEPFSGVKDPYPIDINDFPVKVANTLVDAIENSKTDALLWEDFIKTAVPDKDEWTYVTDDYIDLDPGFYEGDPTQYKGYTVGNQGNVHIIGVGGTGAGKSVFLNHLIATACKKYAPNTLELWLCDYKGTEFKFFLPSEKYPYMLPHIKACLCTSDGDYAGSLYTALRREAERRYNFLKEVGFKNIKDYNEYLRANGREKEVFRRILFINDEFQVIFEKAETKIIEQINKDITYISKVARAAGIHLFFTSQSMKKTLSVDILQQFTLRFALRCDEEVSMSVLGTKYASEIKQKNGYLYVRSMDDPSLKSQKRYRTPFAKDAVLREFIKQMDERAKKENMPKHDVITYEESTIHKIEELDSFYKEIENTGKTIPDYGMFLLGNRMTYSENRAPDNIVLQAVNNSHVISAFGDITDLVNFYKTFMRNTSNWKKKPQLLWNSQIADFHYLCELDKDVPDELQELSNEKTSIYELQELFYNIYENRVASNEKEEPLFIILIGWDKAVGFGIDKDSLYVSKFAKLLQTCGEYNMHFIFINTAVGSIATTIVEACKYRVAGRCDEKTSFALLNSKQSSKPSDMKNGYMYLYRNGEVTRSKIYLSDLTREVKKSEFVL